MSSFPPSRAAPSTPLAAGAMAAALLFPPPRRHLDLDPHARIDEAGDDGGGGGPDIAEILPEDGRDLRPVLGPGDDVVHPDHIGETGAGLLQSRGDIAEALMHLLRQIAGDR